MISNLIHIELAYINTSHPDFIGGERAVQEALKQEEAFVAAGAPRTRWAAEHVWCGVG